MLSRLFSLSNGRRHRCQAWASMPLGFYGIDARLRHRCLVRFFASQLHAWLVSRAHSSRQLSALPSGSLGHSCMNRYCSCRMWSAPHFFSFSAMFFFHSFTNTSKFWFPWFPSISMIPTYLKHNYTLAQHFKTSFSSLNHQFFCIFHLNTKNHQNH